MLQQPSGIGYGCAVLQHTKYERLLGAWLWFVRPQIPNYKSATWFCMLHTIMWEPLIFFVLVLSVCVHCFVASTKLAQMDALIARETGRNFVRRASFVYDNLEKYFIMNVSSATFVGKHLIATGEVDGELPSSPVTGSGSYFCDLYPDDPMELIFDSCELIRQDECVTVSFRIVPKSIHRPPGL